MTLPKVPKLALIVERLPHIFPEGLEYRNYVVREMAAKTLYVMFYAGAIEGTDRWMRPSQVTDMTDAQAADTDEAVREAWCSLTLSNKKVRPPQTWYAANSREPVRDETLRAGFIPLSAVIERQGVPTTSSKPKYAIEKGFAALFDDGLAGAALEAAMAAWRKAHLSKAALARTRLVKQGLTLADDAVVVTFPNGETRAMKPGKSSLIAKAVIEQYAPHFLKHPALLWLSESGNKVVQRDDQLAKMLGLHIDQSKALPDIILVDLGEAQDGSGMRVVFVEVVASDGPVNTVRKAALTEIAVAAGFAQEHLKFLTAYADRGDPVFKKTVSDLAWHSAAWFASEPSHIVELVGND